MSKAHRRIKNPEAVKRRLMEEAIRLAVDTGVSAITVQAVSEAAGVTKGGFLHHFPSKQALIDAVFDEVIARFDAEMAERIGRDPVTEGAFTRAYVDIALGGDAPTMGRTWLALSILMLDDAALRAKWAAWFDGQLARHGDTEASLRLVGVRLAVDGAWVADYCGVALPARRALHAHLLEMARA